MALLMPMNSPPNVEKRAAGVAGVDRRVRLDQTVEDLILGSDRSADGAHDTGGHGVGEAERVADCDHGLSDHEVVGTSHFDRGQGAVGLQLQHGQIGVGVGADQLGVELAFVRQCDGDFGGAQHDVLVGEDIAVFSNEDAGAQAGLREALSSRLEEVVEELVEERILPHGGRRQLPLDDLSGGDVDE